LFDSIEDVRGRLARQEYVADNKLATVVFLATRLNKPVLIEGPAGVGKTELAKSLARAAGTELIRLQCYEGLDEAKALYEWDYRKQLLHIQLDTAREAAEVEEALFSERFLLARPLL